MAYARGSDLTVIMLLTTTGADGEATQDVVNLGSPVSASFNMEVANERDDRLGQVISQTDQVYSGENVTLEYRRDSHEIDRIKAAIRNAQIQRLPPPKFEILRAIEDRNTGAVKTVRYTDLVASVSTSASGKNDAVTETLEMMGGKAEDLAEG